MNKVGRSAAVAAVFAVGVGLAGCVWAEKGGVQSDEATGIAQGVGKSIKLDVDLTAKPIKDQRNLSSAPVLGYAGVLNRNYEDLYNTNKYNTALAMKKAGAWLQRQWSGCGEWQADKKNNYRNVTLLFQFMKDNGFRQIMNLEQWNAIDPATGKRTNDINVVKNVIADYLKWIRANGFEGTVAGFELGNETYFDRAPEVTAERWKVIVPEIKKVWPNAKLGIPMAEYIATDPDLEAVRNRGRKQEWVKDAGFYEFNPHNQWSLRFVEALGDTIKDVTHVIYHFYGAETPYGCTYLGFERIRNFAKLCPQVKDKKVWITEWRERSDENGIAWRFFYTALWRTHYLLTALAHEEVEAMNLHCFDSIANMVSTPDGFIYQLDSGLNYMKDYWNVGPMRFERNVVGATYNLLTTALKQCPVVLRHGNSTTESEESYKTSARFYDSTVAHLRALYSGKTGEDIPAVDGDVEYLVTVNRPGKDADMMMILMVNTTDKPAEIKLSVPGKRLCNPIYRTLQCYDGMLYAAEVPGDGRPWYERAWIDPVGADPINFWANASAAPLERTLTIAPNTIQTVGVPLKPYVKK